MDSHYFYPYSGACWLLLILLVKSPSLTVSCASFFHIAGAVAPARPNDFSLSPRLRPLSCRVCGGQRAGRHISGGLFHARKRGQAGAHDAHQPAAWWQGVSGDAGRLTSALTVKLFTQRLRRLLTAHHIFVLVLLLPLCLPPLRFQLCCRLLATPLPTCNLWACASA